MTENDRLAWLQLAFTPYVGAEGFLLLLQRFGSAKAALDAPVEQIAAIVRHKQAAESWRNGEKRALAQKAAEAALQWEKQDGCRLLLLQDDDFPEMLTQGITAPQPPDCRVVTGYAGGRGRVGIRFADYRQAGGGDGAGGDGGTRFDRQSAQQRLSQAD